MDTSTNHAPFVSSLQSFWALGYLLEGCFLVVARVGAGQGQRVGEAGEFVIRGILLVALGLAIVNLRAKYHLSYMTRGVLLCYNSMGYGVAPPVTNHL